MVKEWPAMQLPYKCPQCPQRFLSLRAMRRHLSKRHGAKT